ncbi:thioredoxin family protein [Paenibacillus terreus]|uniref:Thioredoxin family protein n=1 Tax=Paenibacillus terreus TaxID=1387834 RepID=A0ABV5BGN9_9BACL
MARSNVSQYFGKGLTPEQFMDSMEKNKEAFRSWYDRFAWKDESDREYFASLNHRDDLRVLILAADWCGDVVRCVPVVFRAMESAGIPTEVLILENHDALMNDFLTMGSRSIPIVIFADTGGHVLGHWGPRPAHVQEVMVQFKKENPDREAPDYQDKLDAARAEIRARYGEGTEIHGVIVKELRELISGL